MIELLLQRCSVDDLDIDDDTRLVLLVLLLFVVTLMWSAYPRQTPPRG